MSGQPDEVWYELEVTADVEAVEPVVELFSRYAYNQGVVVEEPFLQDLDGDNLRVDVSKPFLVKAFVPEASFETGVQEAIESGLWFIGAVRPVGTLAVTRREQRDWTDAWKEHYHPVRVTGRFTIAPPWQVVEPESADDLVIVLDPGMAFGTGTHPTTQLCLEMLPDLVAAGDRVFDVGTGTGILAIAAAQLGAGTVDAVDIDPIAVRQASANLSENRLEAPVTIWQSDMSGAPDERYDLVIANIIARILVEVSEQIGASVKPDGSLLLSGIIEEKEALVIERYQALGFTMQRRERMGDWIAQVWTPSAAV